MQSFIYKSMLIPFEKPFFFYYVIYFDFNSYFQARETRHWMQKVKNKTEIMLLIITSLRCEISNGEDARKLS